MVNTNVFFFFHYNFVLYLIIIRLRGSSILITCTSTQPFENNTKLSCRVEISKHSNRPRYKRLMVTRETCVTTANEMIKITNGRLHSKNARYPRGVRKYYCCYLGTATGAMIVIARTIEHRHGTIGAHIYVHDEKIDYSQYYIVHAASVCRAVRLVGKTIGTLAMQRRSVCKKK